MHKCAPIKQSVCLEIDHRKKAPVHVRPVEHLKLTETKNENHTQLSETKSIFT